MDLDCRVREKKADFYMTCYWRLLNFLYKDHVTNEEVHRKIPTAIGEYDELLTLVKRKKLKGFGLLGRQYQRVDRNGLCQLTRIAESRTRKGTVGNSSVVVTR